jgi:DNA polymerase-3 subunit gamma/tau
VRDALSLLDQGIARAAAGRVEAGDVRAMLGLSDRGEVIDLFIHAMAGEIAPALASMARLHLNGADPAELLVELAEFCHFVTRAKLAPSGVDDPAIGENERRRGAELAEKLALGPLTRAWQILIKGVEDVKDSPRPLASAEMALIRLAFAAVLPTPEDALRKLAESGESSLKLAPAAPAGATRSSSSSVGGSALRASPSPAPAPIAAAGASLLARFEDVVELARSKRDIQLCQALESDVRLARFEPGRIEFSLTEGASSAIVQALSRRLAEWTGERWMVAIAAGASAPTLREQAAARRSERLSGLADHPTVRKILERFPGARIVEAHASEIAPAAPASAGDDDVAYADSLGDDDL